MTKQGLKELKELETEIDELRDKAEGLRVRIKNIYREDEDIEAEEAFSMLVRASISMQFATENLDKATTEIQNAYRAEKDSSGLKF